VLPTLTLAVVSHNSNDKLVAEFFVTAIETEFKVGKFGRLQVIELGFVETLPTEISIYLYKIIVNIS
jgi:hypothetical protein